MTHVKAVPSESPSPCILDEEIHVGPRKWLSQRWQSPREPTEKHGVKHI